MLKTIICEARKRMPKYFDKDDLHSVKITVYPKNRLLRPKLLKKYLSPPIWVGQKIKLIIKLEKLENFNEFPINIFWLGKAILEKLPNMDVTNIYNINFLDNEQILEKEIESEFISCEGDVEYKIGSRNVPAPSFHDRGAIPLYTANVKSGDWIKFSLILVALGVLIDILIREIIIPFLDHLK